MRLSIKPKALNLSSLERRGTKFYLITWIALLRKHPAYNYLFTKPNYLPEICNILLWILEFRAQQFFVHVSGSFEAKKVFFLTLFYFLAGSYVLTYNIEINHMSLVAKCGLTSSFSINVRNL